MTGEFFSGNKQPAAPGIGEAGRNFHPMRVFDV